MFSAATVINLCIDTYIQISKHQTNQENYQHQQQCSQRSRRMFQSVIHQHQRSFNPPSVRYLQCLQLKHTKNPANRIHESSMIQPLRRLQCCNVRTVTVSPGIVQIQLYTFKLDPQVPNLLHEFSQTDRRG